MKHVPILTDSSCLLASLLLLFAPAGTNAAESPTLPPQDPARIAAIAAHLPEKPGLPGLRESDRPRWLELAADSGAVRQIRLAEGVLKAPVPPITDEVYLKCLVHGDANIQPQAYWKRHNALAALAFAEAFEQKGRFLAKIGEFLNAYCDEKSWLFAVHDRNADVFYGRKAPRIELGVAHRAELLAFTLALHRPRLPAATCARVDAELERWAFAPYRRLANSATNVAGTVGQSWFVYIYNWNPSCNSGVVRAALNVLESREDRARFVEAAERSSKNYLKGLTSDGYCLEGTSYWSYGYSRYLSLGLAIRAATGGFVDLFADPINRRTIAEYAYGANLYPNSGLPYADGTGAIGPHLLAVARYVCPDVASTAVLNADMRHTDVNFYPLTAFGDPLPAIRPNMDTLPIRTTFPVAQVYIFRPDPAEKEPAHDFAFVIKGGHNNEPHNHNDVGSYELAVGRKRVCGDPRGIVYSRQVWGNRRYLDFPTLASYGHPVPHPAGMNQSAGERFAAKYVSSEYTPERDSVTLDLAGAYPTNCPLKSLLRTVDFDRRNATVTVTDRVAFTSPQTFDTPIVTYSEAIFDYEKQYLTLEVDKETKVDVEIRVKGADWHWMNDVLPHQCRKSPRRLSVALDHAVTEAEVSVVYKMK